MSGGSGGRARIAAVVATSRGSGRTSTVANLAWTLAGSGRRVLVVDWCAGGRRVREYLRPFYVADANLPDTWMLDRFDEDLTPAAESFSWPATTGRITVHTTRSTRYPAVLEEPSAIRTLRADLLDSDYDDVLLDIPAGSQVSAPDLVADLCDTVIVCFQAQPEAISAAADLTARLVKQLRREQVLVAVVTTFEGAFRARGARMRAALDLTFDSLLGRSDWSPDRVINLPFQPFRRPGPVLTIIADDRDTAPSGFGKLTAAVTRGEVTGLPAVDPAFRSWYRRAVGLERHAVPSRVVVGYASPDRPWADWIRDRLTSVGVQVGTVSDGDEWLRSGDPLGLVVVSSRHLTGTSELAAVTGLIERAGVAGTALTPFVLLTDDADRDLGGSAATISVRSTSATPLATRLFDHFGLADRAQAMLADVRRLPSGSPVVVSLPARDPQFVGRDTDIENLRDQLIQSADDAVVIVSGPSGAGKSELALEYAHRFAGDYDGVWWVPAGSESTIVDSLAALDLEAVGRTRDALSAKRRWLLVFDDAPDAAGPAEFLPDWPSTNHVVVTTRSSEQSGVNLLALAPGDSVRLLTANMPGLTQHDALRIAEIVNHLPIALALISGTMTEMVAAQRRAARTVADAVKWSVEALADSLGDPDSSRTPAETLSRTVAVVTDSLVRTSVGRVTMLLAELCAFLSQDGVSLRLVRSAPMLNGLIDLGGADTRALRVDSAEIDRVLWLGARYTLFDVDWGTRRLLRMHPAVQTALRDNMSADERAKRQAEVLEVLAAFAPIEVDEPGPEHTERFTELHRHIEPSGAQWSTSDTVRRWLVNQVLFLYVQGVPRMHDEALELATGLVERWASRHGHTDPLRLRLIGQVANLRRAQGDAAAALELDENVLALQRQSFGPAHPQSLVSARGLAGDLRGLGLFDEAMSEDRETWDGLRDQLGGDHPQTLMATNNYALSLFLAGYTREALGVATDNHNRRRRLLGDNDPRTWLSLMRAGIYHRELGEYDAAATALRNTAQHVQRLVPQPDVLEQRVQYHLAVTERLQGNMFSARERLPEAVRGYRKLLGPHHPDTLAAELSLAAMYRLRGDPAAAGELAERVVMGLLDEVRLPEQHPFVALALIGLGLARCRAGESGLPQTGVGLESLRSQLGEAHPWTLAATVNHAVVMARFGDTGQAVTMMRSARDSCVDYLGHAHRCTEIASGNAESAVPGDPDSILDWKEIDVDIPET
jgi:cellulose biosynthesis protein BcsQ